MGARRMSLREAAQQALEALEESCTPRLSTKHYAEYDAAITALKAALEQPEQEPFAWMSIGGSIWRNKGRDDDIPLYTHPPRREWRGLTDEEIEDCWDGYLSDYQLQMIRTIEDKLKEKNA